MTYAHLSDSQLSSVFGREPMPVNFSDLKGKTLVEVDGALAGSDTILFETDDGCTYEMLHKQDCCECVLVDEVVGDVDDLIRTPLLGAEENTSYERLYRDWSKGYEDSHTWTFYRLWTLKGQVVIRWLGTSNGYYSEKVDFRRIT